MLRTEMSLLSVIALVGAFCLTRGAGYSASSKSKIESSNRDFDYFLLVRQWPGKTCSKGSCPSLHDFGYHFTIHGLWPNWSNGSWPQSCDTSLSFDKAQVTDLLEPLRAEWPNLKITSSDEYFWAHEWSEHGTCALGVLPSEHSYFERTLQLHWRFDLAAAFRQANILPSDKTLYSKEELLNAVSNMYGVRPIVRCVGDELSEIWMCFNKQLRPMPCDPSIDSGKCDRVRISPLPNGSPPDLQQEGLETAMTRDRGGRDRARLHNTRRRLRGLPQAMSKMADAVVHPDASGHSAAGADGEKTSAILTSLSSLDTNRAAAAATRKLRAEMLSESADSIGSAAGAHWHSHHWGDAATDISSGGTHSRSSNGAWRDGQQQQQPGAGTAGTLSRLMGAVSQRLRWPQVPYSAEEVPNGGASAEGWADARRDYVWRSKLREPELGEGSGEQLTGLAVMAGGNGAMVAASAVTDPWVAGLHSGGSVVLHPGGCSWVNMWVLTLAISQQVCAAVIAVSLAVLAGVALMGVIRTSRRRQRRRQRHDGGDRAQTPGRQQWRLSSCKHGDGKGGLLVPYPMTEPLLPDSLESPPAARAM